MAISLYRYILVSGPSKQGTSLCQTFMSDGRFLSKMKIVPDRKITENHFKFEDLAKTEKIYSRQYQCKNKLINDFKPDKMNGHLVTVI